MALPNPLVTVLVGALCLLLGSGMGFLAGQRWASRDTLPAVIAVTLAESGQTFQARLDTGAVVSSINAHELKVLGGDALPSGGDNG